MHLLSAVLSLLGLNAATPPANPLRAFLWKLARWIEGKTGLSPVAGAPTVGAPSVATGTVIGTLNATEPDQLPLTFTVSTEPTHGSVTVDASGTFTYIPTVAARLAAAAPYAPTSATQDFITITISDGLSAITETVTVPVSAAQVSATIAVGAYPASVAFSPDGSRVYVVGSGALTVINAATNTVTAGIEINGLTMPSNVAVSPDGGSVYVPFQIYVPTDSGALAVIDTSTNTLSNTIPLPFTTVSSGVAVTSGGNLVFVTDSGSGTVSVIDPANGSVWATIDVGHVPTGVAVSPDDTHAYVANKEGLVSVINIATSTVSGVIPVGNEASGLAISPDGSHVYVANTASNTVSVIDTATGVVTATVPVGNGPYGVAVSPDGSYAYTGNESGSVSAIDTATHTVIATIDVVGAPGGVAVSPDGGTLYVTEYTTATVTVVSL